MSYAVPLASRARIVGLALAMSLVLGGCVDNGSSRRADGTDSPPPAAANAAPTLSGQPLTSIVAGRTYSFTPTAADADGDALSFSITGKPEWAEFDARTGRLSGTPQAGEVGSYTLTIRVSDGTAEARLAFTVQVVAAANGRATVSWQPPTARTDGSTLTDLAGYRIYYGTSRDDLAYQLDVRNPSVTSWVIENLTAGTWYFVATSVDSKGIESSFSNMASKTIV